MIRSSVVGKQEIEDLGSSCHVLIDCLKLFSIGTDKERSRAEVLLRERVGRWFSINALAHGLDSNASGSVSGSGDVESMMNSSRTGRLIVKKRPSAVAVGCRREVLRFFRALELFLSVVTMCEGETESDAEEVRAVLAQECRELCDSHGDAKIIEASFWVVGALGTEILRIIEDSLAHPHSVHYTVVVDTYETYLSRAILVGSGLMGPVVPPSESKHVALLPWLLYLSSWSGIFPLKDEGGWSHRMSRNVLFSISDSLVRQSISSSDQSRESVLSYGDALQGNGTLGSSGAILPVLPLSGNALLDNLPYHLNTSSYREGLSFNGGAEALVNTFLMEMSAHGYHTDLHSQSARVGSLARGPSKRHSPSPSPRGDAIACQPRSPRYISPSVSQFVDAGQGVNPKKMRKLALQFAVKLGNLYATQDVHAMLSFLPAKESIQAPNLTEQRNSLEELHTDEDKDESINSVSDFNGSPLSVGKYPISFDFRPEAAGEVLREKLFSFLGTFSVTAPLSGVQAQQLSLFLSLCLLNRIASFCPPNFGRHTARNVRQREVAFGVQFGYEKMVWPMVVTTFLDTCFVGGMCAALGENQMPLSKQLAATVTSFMRHCFSRDFVLPSGKTSLNLISRRWAPKFSFLTNDALGNGSEGTAKYQLLKHFFFLTCYLRSVLEENTVLARSAEKSEERNQDEATEYLMSPHRRKGEDEEDGRFNFLKQILVEGESILQALHKCMALLPWNKVLKATDGASETAETVGVSRSLFSARGRPVLPASLHRDSEFVKFCVHYYLFVLDALIEIALFTSTYPSYLTSTLLRYDESDAYLTGPVAGMMENLSFHSRVERIGWQHFFNYHCLTMIKDGTQHVDMQFITTLRQWQTKFPSFPLCLHPFDSLHLDHLQDFTPSPDMAFSDSWYFLRILNHAKNVTRYICATPDGKDGGLIQSPRADANDSLRHDVSRFVDGVTPFLSTSSGTFTQSLSVPHQHPFSCLEECFASGRNEGVLKASLEMVCRDLWLRTQALQLLSAASSPIRVPLSEEVMPESLRRSMTERVFMLNGSASKTYVRLLFLRIVQSVFSQHGNYDERVERQLLGTVSAETKHLYDLAKRLWTSCLTLTLQTIQSMSHHHTKARETAMHLGVHAVLSRLLDALSSYYLKKKVPLAISRPDAAVEGQTRISSTEEVDLLEDTILLEDVPPPPLPENPKVTNVSLEEPTNTPPKDQSAAPFVFSIPQLCLDDVGPALYFLSSGDTGAALQASLFPGNSVGSPIPSNAAASEGTSEETMEMETQTADKGPTSPNVPPLEFPSANMNAASLGKNEGDHERGECGLINAQHLYADAYLLSCAICCTCSLLVQHSGMLRYESTVSIALLRKRLHLPEASYHLLYGGDQTWKKHVEDTRNSATLKKYLGWCCSEQRGIHPSFVFRSLRDCISSAAASCFLGVLEKWLDGHSLTMYRNFVCSSSKQDCRWRHIAAKSFSDANYAPISTDVNDDSSLHSIGLFVLLRLLIPRPHWNQQFDFHHRLGAGGFGTVMAADYHGSTVSSEPASVSTAKSKWAEEETKIFELYPHVAVKMMPLLLQHDVNSGMLPMCHAEVLAMMCLRGRPHIVPLLSFGCSDDGYFIVLPRYDSGSLYDWRLRQYPPGCAALIDTKSRSGAGKESQESHTLFSLCCPLITQLLEAVACMHEQQIRHNDIKAENLLIEMVDRIPRSKDSTVSAFQEDSDVVLPRTIRLGDFGSCDTCTDEDMQELLRDLVAGESRFMEGRWGFGNGTEAVQPPEIIVPRWRYELMRTVTLHFVASQHSRSGPKKQPLATSFASVRKQQNEEAGDAAVLLQILRQIELSADIWSCGCLLYEVLTGVMLFGEGKLGRLTALATAAREQLAERTRGEQWMMWDNCNNAVKTSPALDHWDTDDLTSAVGSEVVDFLLELLSIDPLSRPTATQALEKWRKIVVKHTVSNTS